MFLIVLFGSFGAITGMNNGKDTLLYAKFIADVGRWDFLFDTMKFVKYEIIIINCIID